MSRRPADRTRRLAHLIAPLVLALAALASPPGGFAAWTPYFGPEGTMYDEDCCDHAQSGWNYHTNNRVYRPIGFNFALAWGTQESPTIHFSATNYADNPFYQTPYGYNSVFCWWMWNGAYPSVSPVTCQSYA